MAAVSLCLQSFPGLAENAQLIRQEPLRTNASFNAQTIMGVARRTEVRILESQQGWTRVEAAGGRTGWLPEASLDRHAIPSQGGIFSVQGAAAPAPERPVPRALPRASRHALVLTIGSIAATPSVILAGSSADARLGAEIARLSGIPDSNIRYRADGELDREGLHQAFAELDARMGNGDQAIVYLSAAGVHRQQHGRCTEAILTHEHDAFPLDELQRHLQLLAGKADKVFLILDTGRGDSPADPPAVASRFARQFSDPGCATAQPGLESGRLPANVLVLAASRPNENAGDTAAGGLFSQALLACLSGGPLPGNPSGLPTGEALIACSRQLIAAGPAIQHPGLAGNGELALAPQTFDQNPRDASQVLHALHAQRDQRRRVELTHLSAAPGLARLRVNSSEPGYVYILSAGKREFQLLYPPSGSQQLPISRTTDLEIPVDSERNGEWLVLVSDAVHQPRRAGFIADGPGARLPVDANGARDLLLEFLSGDGSRNCLFSETRNLGPSQARACSSRFAATLLDSRHDDARQASSTGKSRSTPTAK